MVRTILSFRALFRKASCMFCASFSILISFWPSGLFLFSSRLTPGCKVMIADSPGSRGVGSREAEALLRGSRFGHQVLNLGEQRRTVVRDAVFDDPFDAAGVEHFAVADLVDARGVEHLQVLERVAVHDQNVGRVAATDASQSGL